MFFNKKTKVFCIGRNKTGTTSLGQALKSFGYKLGDQAKAELLTNDWAKRDFHRIINLCKTADAFQDAPFSFDFTFQALDTSFPRSKYILTIRNNADQWYESLTRFHKKIVGKNRLPTPNDLKEHSYRYKGWLWEQAQYVYGIDEATLYNYEIYTAHYENHNARVLQYFKYRPNDLLVLNLSEPSAMENLCSFLGVNYSEQIMPHLNKSK